MTRRHAIIAILLILCACGEPRPQSPADAVKPAAEKSSGHVLTLDEFDAGMAKAALQDACSQTAQDSVAQLSKSLDYIDMVLPNVTPEESAYLKRESEAAYKLSSEESLAKTSHASSNARWTALENRRLYHVWSARKYLADAITSVRAIYNPEQVYKEWSDGRTSVSPGFNVFRNEQADTFERMLRASSYVDSSAGALREVAIAEQSRRDQLLTADQYDGLYRRALLMSDDLRRAMGCQFAHLMLDKPVRTDVVR